MIVKIGGISMNLLKKMITIGLVVTLLLGSIGKSDNIIKAAGVDDAIGLNVNAQWSQNYYITQEDNSQWYKINLPSDGKLEVKVIHYSGVSWYLYNEDLSTLFKETGGSNSGTETSPTTDTTSWILSKGTYYLNVCEFNNGMGSRGGEGKYRVNASFESYNTTDDMAISYDKPQQYSLGKKIIGAITNTDAEDWYCFTISNKGYYNFKITHYSGIQVNIYNEDLSVNCVSSYLPGGEELSPDTDSMDEEYAIGTYFMKITESDNYMGSRGGKGKYSFVLSRLSASNCNHEYKATDIEATYLSKGYTLHKCEKCGKTYKDEYTVKKTLSQGYIYSWGIETGKKKIRVSYQRISDVSGYQIRYSTNKKFKKNVKVVKVNKSKTSKKITRLKKRKKYYIQVRGYKKIKGKTIYGKWSTKRWGKTK